MKQVLIAVGIALTVSILLTPLLIRLFTRQGLGHEIRDDGPPSHKTKRGTPSMGGVAILAGIWAGYLGTHLAGLAINGEGPSASGLLVLFLATALGGVGFVDDLIKIRRSRNLGLNKTAKILGQITAAVLFGVLVLRFRNSAGLTPASADLSYVREIATVTLAPALFVLFCVLIVSAWSNAVNFTDGLDGLAGGCMAMVTAAYVLITFWQYRNACATAPGLGCYNVRDPLDLALIAAATAGACVGFLWWNAAPARIFMGDTGSLALGGIIAGLSMTSRTEVLAVVLGSLFVAEITSVVMQILAFRTTGRRVFRMAPFHHHFELAGWVETTVIIRFWLLTAISCGLGVALFYGEWLTAMGDELVPDNAGPDPLVPSAPVLVTGGGVTGRSVLAALAALDVATTLCDDDAATLQRHAGFGVTTMSTSTAAQRIADYALVVTSPGFRPTAPVLAAAAAAGVPIWGDVELAWRLDRSGSYGPPRRWLAVTGTNGKTTTTSMLHAMLTAAGLRAHLCGNIGSPVLDALREPAELLAVELSSFQLHWAPSVRPEAGAVLNIAEDHLDWHAGMADYTAAKARVLNGRVAIVGLDDPRATALLDTASAPVRVGFRLGEPGPGELGVRDGLLVDRAFANDLALTPVSSIPVPGPIGVLDALAAAALARCIGAPARAVADALASFAVGRHRAEVVAVADGITYVDDSKATNPHAAEASVLAYPRVVWVAGGLLKGTSIEETVARIASRLVGAVLMGRDRAQIAEALSRHAPDVPVVLVVASEDADVDAATERDVTSVTRLVQPSGTATGARVMAAAVAAARELARPGDTVLLAPAGASFDQFSGYGERGDAFAAAVRAMAR